MPWPFSVVIAAACLLSALVAAAQTPPPAADWLPDGAIYTLHIDQPAALLDLAVNFNLPALLSGNPTDKGLQLLVDTLSKRAGPDPSLKPGSAYRPTLSSETSSPLWM
jgi:hypothetical protein